MPVFEVFHVKGIRVNGHALPETQFVRLCFNFQFGLLVQFRGIRYPYKNGIRAFDVLIVPHEGVFYEGSSDNRLSRTGRGGKGNHLWNPKTLVTALCVFSLFQYGIKSVRLEVLEFAFHSFYLL